MLKYELVILLVHKASVRQQGLSIVSQYILKGVWTFKVNIRGSVLYLQSWPVDKENDYDALSY